MNRLRTLVAPLALAVLASACSSATAFLYQGRLEHGPRESNGQQTGTWKYWFDADHLKVRATGNFERDQPVGRWEFFHENGTKRWEVSFQNEAYSGESTAWWPNGNMRSRGSFTAGLETGPWTFWSEAGTKHAEGSFVRGARDGEWLYYAADGVAATRFAFERGAERAFGSAMATASSDAARPFSGGASAAPAMASSSVAPPTPAAGVVAARVTKTQTGEGSTNAALARVSGFSMPELTQIYVTGEAPPAAGGGGHPPGDPRNPPSQPKRDDAKSDPYEGKPLPWTRLVQGDGRTLDPMPIT